MQGLRGRAALLQMSSCQLLGKKEHHPRAKMTVQKPEQEAASSDNLWP